MPYSGTMTFSKLLLDRGRIKPRLLELNSMPYRGTITLSKLLEELLIPFFLLELEDFDFLELDDSPCSGLLESVESSSVTLEELWEPFFLLELEDFVFWESPDSVDSSSLASGELLVSVFLVELDDLACLELDDLAFLELLETSFAEELVSITASSLSFPLSVAVAESPSQLAQKAAVNDSRTFFQCLCKSMLIIRPFFRAKYTKLVRFDYSTSLFGLGEFPLEVPATIFFAGTGRFCLFGTAAGFARGTRFFFVIIVFFLVIFSVFIF